MLGQKQAVVEEVKALLPNFVPYQDVALNLLTRDQLESLKVTIGTKIVNGDIEYGKDKNNVGETMAYARSMVMNHLKKARELNGNQSLSKGAASPKAPKVVDPFMGMNIDIMSDDMKALVESLV